MTKEIFDLEVGQRIALIRRQKRMTQQQVAEQAGISTPYYSQIENGSKTMSCYVLARITEALETSSDYLLFGRMDESADILNRDFEQLTGSEIRTIRVFLERCVHKLHLLETCDSISSDHNDDSELTSPVPLR